jgi:hypothetical protein
LEQAPRSLADDVFDLFGCLVLPVAQKLPKRMIAALDARLVAGSSSSDKAFDPRGVRSEYFVARILPLSTQAVIRETFLSTQSVKATARATGVSRNTIRKLLRTQGLGPGEPTQAEMLQPPPVQAQSLKSLDWQHLRRLANLFFNDADRNGFNAQIEQIGTELAGEFGVAGSPSDQLLLQLALSEYINHQRFLLRSFSAAGAHYEGPWAKHHDRVAKAARQWNDAAQASLRNFREIIAELRAKNARSRPVRERTNIMVNQIQVQTGIAR